MDFLIYLEQTAIATWVRESPSLWAYATVLTLHTLGLSFLVGLNTAIDLRILGIAARMPLAPMEKTYPIMWIAFWVNAISGTLLFMADATVKAFQLVFIVKMICIVLAVVNMQMLRTRVFHSPVLDKRPLSVNSKMLALSSLILWAGAITAGRLIAYIK